MIKKHTRRPDASPIPPASLEEAEPFWMQDTRLAQRKIAAQMAAIRASKTGGRPGGSGQAASSSDCGRAEA